jgi:iron complex transport system substrate-binding protein
MRIVSLLASGTEIVCGLGLGDRLVGISHECDYPSTVLSRPRVSRPRFDPEGLSSAEIDRAVRETMLAHGSVYELDQDLLRELEPDLILTQAVCEVCAVPTSVAEEAAAGVGGRATVLSLDAHDVVGMLDTIRRVGVAVGEEERAARYLASLQARMAAVATFVASAPRHRVLAVEWLAPPFVPGHWTPEMITIAGGENLRGDVGRPSRQVSWGDLASLDPDILVVMPCGYGLEGARDDADRHSEHLIRTAPRAIDEGRAFVVDGSAYFNRSGPRIVDGIEILAALFHGEQFPDYDVEGCAAPWRPALSRQPGAGRPSSEPHETKGENILRYNPVQVQPMREELTRLGFQELRTPQAVEAVMAQGDGTLLMVVNSVCGCAAGKARPGVELALRHEIVPDRLATVFAGMELEATERVRAHFMGYPPSSPQIALFKDGELVHMLERKDIEGRDAEAIATDLTATFEKYCTSNG